MNKYFSIIQTVFQVLIATLVLEIKVYFWDMTQSVTKIHELQYKNLVNAKAIILKKIDKIILLYLKKK